MFLADSFQWIDYLHPICPTTMAAEKNLWPPYVIGADIIFLPCEFYLLSFVLSFFLTLWPPCVGDADIIFLPCGVFLSSSFFLSSSNLSGLRLDVFHTWCGPSANLEYRYEMCCTRLAGNTGRKKSPFWHHRTTLSDYIFGSKACIDNRKKTY